MWWYKVHLQALDWYTCKGMIIGNTDGNIHGCPGDSLFPEHLSQYPFLKMHVKVLTRRVADKIKKCFGPLLHNVWLNWALTPWDMKKIYETHSWHMKHLSRIAVISRQASYCSSPIGGRDPKGVQTLQWHVTLGCQDDNLCGCQDDLFLQNGSMHIPFRIHEILKILIANNSQICIQCIFFTRQSSV